VAINYNRGGGRRPPEAAPLGLKAKMNYTALPLDDLIASLDPETRCDFDRLRNDPHFLDMTGEELFAAVYACGYLARLLSGRIEFDRSQFRAILRMD
jgi:hypothetical protein